MSTKLLGNTMLLFFNVIEFMLCIYIYSSFVNKSLSRQSSSIPNPPRAHASSHVSNSIPSTSTSSVILNNLRTNETEFMAKLSSCVSHMDAFENPAAQVFAQCPEIFTGFQFYFILIIY